MAELAAFSLARRRAYVVFDADHLKNQHVRQAEIRLAFMLHAAGALLIRRRRCNPHTLSML
jgi:hypothetical protein